MFPPSRIGITGTGFIASGFARHLSRQKDLEVSRVLTRRRPDDCLEFPRRDALTTSLEQLIENSDLVVECSGDVAHASRVIYEAFQASLPVVTMNSEFHVTAGSYFADQGYLTEAEGDQPGCLAALKRDLTQMGFRPLVYGNMKRFLNHYPTPDDMRYWAKKQGISVNQATAFTDGTKIQIEQALVANGMEADIVKPGLMGVSADSFDEAVRILSDTAIQHGRPISDYILNKKCPGGVFIAATHDKSERDVLRYLNLGDGPYYVLSRNHHLCHLEICKTIRYVLDGGAPLLNNSIKPRVGVAAVAKRTLEPGTTIHRGIGGFDVRGVAYPIEQMIDLIPIGLLDKGIVTRKIEPEAPLTWDNAECRETLAMDAWKGVMTECRKDSGEARDNESLQHGISRQLSTTA